MALADPAQWAYGRNPLIIEGTTHRDATPAFLDMYAASINDHLLPLTTNQDARIRLNAAIVAARIAAKAGNGRLAPLTLALLKDSSDGVVLWGLQTAKYVVPALLAAGDTKKADAIAKAAVDAIKNHMTPAIVEEAYRVLLLNPNLPGQTPIDLSTIKTLDMQAFLTNPIALYDFRIKLYDDVEPPKQPLADTWVSTFFTSDKVWIAESAAQRGQALNLMLALLKGAAKQNAAVPSPEMVDVMKRTGQAFEVVADHLKNSSLHAAAHTVSLITANNTPDEITPMIGTLDTAIAALNLPTTTP